MKITRKLITLLLALVLVFSMLPAVHAAGNQNTTALLQQLIRYYLYYQDDAQTDIARVLAELSEIDEAQAETWKKIMDFWSYANDGMEIPTDVLPDGLPEDDSLCIVVLGYALGPYGGIKPELTGRLEVALESAEKYPNAYILCTGGATASRTNKKTEAGQMAGKTRNRGRADHRRGSGLQHAGKRQIRLQYPQRGISAGGASGADQQRLPRSQRLRVFLHPVGIFRLQIRHSGAGHRGLRRLRDKP